MVAAIILWPHVLTAAILCCHFSPTHTHRVLSFSGIVACIFFKLCDWTANSGFNEVQRLYNHCANSIVICNGKSQWWICAVKTAGCEDLYWYYTVLQTYHQQWPEALLQMVAWAHVLPAWEVEQFVLVGDGGFVFQLPHNDVDEMGVFDDDGHLFEHVLKADASLL